MTCFPARFYDMDSEKAVSEQKGFGGSKSQLMEDWRRLNVLVSM